MQTSCMQARTGVPVYVFVTHVIAVELLLLLYTNMLSLLLYCYVKHAGLLM
jgi:hypothetical protein